MDAVNISVGQSIEPASALFEISDRSQVNMVARVYEEDLGKVSLGQEVRIRTLSYPDKVFKGKVTLIGPALDPASRTAVVWVRLARGRHQAELRETHERTDIASGKLFDGKIGTMKCAKCDKHNGSLWPVESAPQRTYPVRPQ